MTKEQEQSLKMNKLGYVEFDMSRTIVTNIRENKDENSPLVAVWTESHEFGKVPENPNKCACNFNVKMREHNVNFNSRYDAIQFILDHITTTH